jgi:hypothetical protein
MIESALGDARLFTYIIHAGGVVAGYGKTPDGGIQDGGSCLFTSLLGHLTPEKFIPTGRYFYHTREVGKSQLREY